MFSFSFFMRENITQRYDVEGFIRIFLSNILKNNHYAQQIMNRGLAHPFNGSLPQPYDTGICILLIVNVIRTLETLDTTSTCLHTFLSCLLDL